MTHLDRDHEQALEFAALFDELEVARKVRAKATAKKRAWVRLCPGPGAIP